VFFFVFFWLRRNTEGYKLSRMKKELVHTSVKLPADLADQIDALSLAERRSRNSQVIVLLEEALEKRGVCGCSAESA
jgi:hypothetical protein